MYVRMALHAYLRIGFNLICVENGKPRILKRFRAFDRQVCPHVLGKA